MSEQKKITTTVEPVEEQAPNTENKTPDSTTTPADAKPTAPTQTADKPAAGTLPGGYLAGRSMVDDDGVMLPEYLDKFAQELAQKFKPLSATSFQRAFLTKAKEANKKKVPYSVKKNCAQGMVVQAMKLVNRKKDPAPAVLLDMVKLATATVADDATFNNLYMHLDAICTYMMMK